MARTAEEMHTAVVSAAAEREQLKAAAAGLKDDASREWQHAQEMAAAVEELRGQVRFCYDARDRRQQSAWGWERVKRTKENGKEGRMASDGRGVSQ
jgi:hypothetical protein